MMKMISFQKIYNRLKKYSEQGKFGNKRRISYKDAFEALSKKPHIELPASGPETLNMLERLNKVAFYNGLILLLE